MFSFNNKLWIAGGYANWISESNVKNDIWYSENDGATWVQATSASGEDLKRFGHSVVSYGGKLYMIGGEKITGSTREGITSVLSSTDGINWTKLPQETQLPLSFTKRINSNKFMGQGDLIWIIGGFAGSSVNFSVPEKLDVDMILTRDSNNTQKENFEKYNTVFSSPVFAIFAQENLPFRNVREPPGTNPESM